MKAIRIGQGYDVHQFENGKELRLGGVVIPHTHGLKAHSDGDVLLHAIIDSLLGAAGLGDIGELFPDSDIKWKDADSSELLSSAISLLKENGWQVINIDSTVVCESPKITPFKGEICERIAEIVGVSPDAVSVKATTNEMMGYIGRGEGVLALATSLICQFA